MITLPCGSLKSPPFSSVDVVLIRELDTAVDNDETAIMSLTVTMPVAGVTIGPQVNSHNTSFKN